MGNDTRGSTNGFRTGETDGDVVASSVWGKSSEFRISVFSVKPYASYKAAQTRSSLHDNRRKLTQNQ